MTSVAAEIIDNMDNHVVDSDLMEKEISNLLPNTLAEVPVVDILSVEPVTSPEPEFGNRDLEYLNPLPILDSDRLKRSFVLDYSQIEVTSLDIASHGCFVLAGCSNGMILLYDMSTSQQQGHVIGHIFAKGLHTNLLLNVKVTDDCRFCFAGVHKGSSELLAIDLGRLPVTSLPLIKANQKQSLSTTSTFPYELIKTYRRADAKLRGFSAVVRVGLPSDLYSSRDANTYRLACGKGIKNVHVWQFEPSTDDKEPIWTCICDVPSNGMTIENIVFRAAGRQVISKSSDANLRVWDLINYDPTSDAGSNNQFKPPYEDISNSQDMKAVLDHFAFGGTYSFAIVKLGAPKAANRDSFEMPERSAEDSQGNRRKRMMRQIKEVIGTNDGRHVIIICTDGSVMYFCRNEDESTDILEFNSLQCDPEQNQTWMIRRVGRTGQAVLLRAVRAADDKSTIIHIDPLESIAAEVRSTKCIGDISWNSWGYYSRSIPMPPAENINPNVDVTISSSHHNHSTTAISSSNSIATPKVSVKRLVANAKAMSDSASASAKRDTPSYLSKLLQPSPRSVFQPKSSSLSSSKQKTPQQTPDMSNLQLSNRSYGKSSPHDDISRLVYHQTQVSPKRTSSRAQHHHISSAAVDRPVEVLVKRTREKSVNFRDYDDIESLREDDGNDDHKRPKIMRPVPRIPKIIESNDIIPLPIVPPHIIALRNTFNTLKQRWLDSMRDIIPDDAVHIPLIMMRLGPKTRAQLDVITQDHDRMRAQFMSEIFMRISYQFQRMITTMKKDMISHVINIHDIICKYHHDIDMLIIKEKVDLRISYDMDAFEANIMCNMSMGAISFQYSSMFVLAKSFEEEVRGILCDGLNE